MAGHVKYTDGLRLFYSNENSSIQKTVEKVHSNVEYVAYFLLIIDHLSYFFINFLDKIYCEKYI